MKTGGISPKLWSYLIFVSGFIILLPSLIFQDIFSQTDHGRDLYAFALTTEGAAPYRDYLWVYGPLMPYYYGLFMKLFGISISSVLLGETVLKFACGMTFFAILRKVSSGWWACLSSAFFMSFYPYFFHTYSHTGGILCILLAVWSLTRYIYSLRPIDLVPGLVAIFFLGFIKLNFGVVTWIHFIVSLCVIDLRLGVPFRARRSWYISFLLLPVLAGMLYVAITAGLPEHIIKQSFPFSATGSQYVLEPSELPRTVLTLVRLFTASSWLNTAFLLIAMIFAVGFLARARQSSPDAAQIRLTVLSLILLFVMLGHEFLLSGLHYRAIWATSIFYLLVFIMGSRLLSLKPVSYLAVPLLVLLILFRVDAQYRYVQAHAHPIHFFDHPRGGILLGNDPGWLRTVLQTSAFLAKHVGRDEYFMALPADPLYYYLLDQRSPTYETIFADFNITSAAQERQTLDDLARKPINWIALSNLGKGADPTFGEFGVTNSRLLSGYIKEHFYPIRQFGPWDKNAHWITHHAVQILRRAK